MSDYKIYAVEYFRRQAMITDLMIRPPAIEMAEMSYYVWAIVGDNETIVVDTGYKRETAERRGRSIDLDIADAFALVDVDVSQVDKVILTHLHWDHAGCLDLFPQAQFFIQHLEMLFWSGPYSRYPFYRSVLEPDDIAAIHRLNLDGRVAMINGSGRIVPGVNVHLAGGHTPGMQIVEVATAKGPAVIASDAVKTYLNLTENAPEPFLHDVPGMLDGYELVRGLVGEDGPIFSGHDPAVLDRFKKVADKAVVFG